MTSRILLLATVCLAGLQCCSAEKGSVELLDALPGFKIEHIHKADAKFTSWISMAKDSKGRLLLGAQRNQPMTRITLDANGAMVGSEIMKLEIHESKLPIKHPDREEKALAITEAMGILDAFESLYVNGIVSNKEGKTLFGLFRCKDADGDGHYENVEFLREWKGGSGEHGAHGIVAGHDKKLYIVCGNFVDVPGDILPSSPHRNYADDRALPRAEDGNGFGSGRKPPGGYVIRLDPDGTNAELFSSGQRNCYDIGVNFDGEIFGFDSDMEWDWGMPWYRPVRVFQAVSGGDHGFREGTAKWPEYYSDSLPANVNIGIGCPTGVVFGTGAKFPAKYQKAFYILDWSYGRLVAVHLKPDGGGYGGSWENFVAPKGIAQGSAKTPLNLTDAVIGNDGSMYFTTGGRGTAPNLYRVSYSGAESTAAADLHDKEGASARELRHKIEAMHGKPDQGTMEAVWKHLGSEDRYVRYAARIALERQAVGQWTAEALGEKNPNAGLTALLALARLSKPETQPEILNALGKFPMSKLSESQQLDKLRVVEVSIARQAKPSGEAASRLINELDPMFPSKSDELNLELCQVLLALEAPNAAAKTVALLNASKTQEEQISYMLFLRTAKIGWTSEARQQYFKWFSKNRAGIGHSESALTWFKDAGRPYSDGASFPKFIGNMYNEARKHLTEEEQTSLADVLSAYTPPDAKPKPKPAPKRALVKEWQAADLLPAIDQVGKSRNYERGKKVFADAQCFACHKFGNEGGSVGPDLTAVSSRFQRKDILESVIDPSKVVSEQYQNSVIKTNDGQIIEGRIIEENDAKIVVMPNMLEPEKKKEIKKADLKSRMAAKTSPMPSAALDTFSQEEILDLLAYIESQGKKDHANFAK